VAFWQSCAIQGGVSYNLVEVENMIYIYIYIYLYVYVYVYIYIYIYIYIYYIVFVMNDHYLLNYVIDIDYCSGNADSFRMLTVFVVKKTQKMNKYRATVCWGGRKKRWHSRCRTFSSALR
jgi:hypothetical protein